jgi:uncharacterized protein DUF4159
MRVFVRTARLSWVCWLGLALLATAEGLDAQRWGGRGIRLEPNLTYDGRFTFARIRYTVYRRSGWEFDYPTMERNLMTMMDEVTALHPQVLPGAQIHRLDISHPIFDTFFRIASLDMSYPHDRCLKAEFFGIFEDNDPAKRLLVVINYNNDIGDYMEWSGTAGWWPVNITNEAYKLAINYIVYGLTR